MDAAAEVAAAANGYEYPCDACNGDDGNDDDNNGDAATADVAAEAAIAA